MLDRDMIRTLIRDVVAEEVRHLKGTHASADVPSAVTITSDEDLAAFARQVLALAKDPGVRAAIMGGRHPFSLARQSSAPPIASVAAAGDHRIDQGVVTERAITKLPKGVSRLLLGTGVSITPLALDKARSRNISIERVEQ
jgi:hypothetical protein